MTESKKYTAFFGVLIAVASLLWSCNDDFLDAKPDKSLVVPATLEDLQALLDNSQRVMNVVPALGTIASDDAFTATPSWKALLNATERNAHVWADNVYEGERLTDWSICYEQVFYANIVLSTLSTIPVTVENENQWNAIKGAALFFRAHAFYQLTHLFTLPYSEKSTSSLGLPLCLLPDVNVVNERASLEETFARIIADLTESVPLLPVKVVLPTRPSQGAALALLAKVHLDMELYEQAQDYASQALQLNNTLLDYNTLSASASRPVARFNEETLFYTSQITYTYVVSPETFVDTALYAQYSANDLRRTIFFRLFSPNRYFFKGSYTGRNGVFGGIANDEVYLIRAECRARSGDLAGARADLNALLVKRFRTGTFVAVTENDPFKLLSIILKERRKELVFRSTRWADLRRLNKDERFAISLARNIDGNRFTLPPNDPRYTFPIPDEEILASAIKQNPR